MNTVMRFLKIYKNFIIGSIILPLGFSIIFGTIFMFMPHRNSVTCTWFESVYNSAQISYIIWFGFVLIFIGMGYIFGSQESKELNRNIKELFTKDKSL